MRGAKVGKTGGLWFARFRIYMRPAGCPFGVCRHGRPVTRPPLFGAQLDASDDPPLRTRHSFCPPRNAGLSDALGAVGTESTTGGHRRSPNPRSGTGSRKSDGRSMRDGGRVWIKQGLVFPVLSQISSLAERSADVYPRFLRQSTSRHGSSGLRYVASLLLRPRMTKARGTPIAPAGGYQTTRARAGGMTAIRSIPRTFLSIPPEDWIQSFLVISR